MRVRRPEQHADWLALVEPEGQFLTVPVLKRAFPSGLEGIPKGLRQCLRDAAPKNDTPQSERDVWVDLLLRDVLAWGPQYVSGGAAAQYRLELPIYATMLAADAALIDPKTQRPRVLVSRYPRGTDFAARIRDERWNASPIDRLTSLCQANDARIGVLADGESLCVVWAPAKGVGGYATFDSTLFTEGHERSILQAFISLFGARRFFAVEEREQIETLFERSAEAQAEVTKDLGRQVRDAVELLVSSISEKNLARGGELLRAVPPQQVYEAAVTVMMRVVFLLFAEERGLLPLDDDLYAASYAASTLRAQLVEDAESDGDEPLRLRGAAWFRLLALTRVIYAGTHHDRLHLPAYGGRLFDPDRFAFLERFPIDDLTMLAILDAIQTLPLSDGGSKERLRLSFRALDVEQIGHVYEGLLDHGADRIDETYVGLRANTDNDEMTLREIEDRARVAGSGGQPLISFFSEQTGRSPNAVAKDLQRGQALVNGGDPEKRRSLRSACDNDDGLMQRVAPYAYLLRNTLQQLPSVYAPHSLIVRRTRARRDSGTEYTPRELAEEIVHYALEPLCYGPNVKPSEELLALKICDPAVGSGAFLVAACRYLADRVVEAWVAEDTEKAKSDRDDLTLEARRLVVDRCLYGVDKDAMAVDMAKLSLWLVTMARERPFTFLDHTIRHGDSLLGIHNLDQLRYLHIDPAEGTQYGEVARQVTEHVNDAAALCASQEVIPVNTIRQARQKQALNERAVSMVHDLSDMADAIVGVALAYASSSQRQRDQQFKNLGAALLLPDSVGSLRVTTKRNLQLGLSKSAELRVPFHWPLAFPEVFERSPYGFDAMIGNPPFIGGKKITGLFGKNYRDYLISTIGNGARGHADIVAYFFLRAAQLSKAIGLLATNTIAQGDTRFVGLGALVDANWQIHRAVRTRPWPGEAGVSISEVWLTQKKLAKCILDGVDVPNISPLLRVGGSSSARPFTLHENRGTSFIGSYISGTGFILSPREAASIIDRSSSNSKVLYPYLTADDLCSNVNGAPSRWVIDFHDWSEQEAKQFTACFDIVEALVKPDRQRKNPDGTFVLRRPLPELWWQYADKRPALQRATASLDLVIAMPLVSKVVLPLRYETKLVFSHRLCVIASSNLFLFACLTSTIHRSWARQYSSTLGTTTNYSPSDCFETYPFPRACATSGKIVESIDACRREYMGLEQIGMTTLYNRVNDGNEHGVVIDRIRALHGQLDRAICDAYGWTDIDLDYGFHETEEGQRWTMSENAREEVLARLLELNHQRHAEEVASGVVPRVSGKGERKAQRKAKSAPEGLSFFPNLSEI